MVNYIRGVTIYTAPLNFLSRKNYTLYYRTYKHHLKGEVL